MIMEDIIDKFTIKTILTTQREINYETINGAIQLMCGNAKTLTMEIGGCGMDALGR